MASEISCINFRILLFTSLSLAFTLAEELTNPTYFPNTVDVKFDGQNSVYGLAENNSFNNSVNGFKRPPFSGKAKTMGVLGIDVVHEHAVLQFRAQNIQKSQAGFNLWQPKVNEPDGQFSLSQIWMIYEDAGGLEETIEAGWIVRDNTDGKPRFFVYYTNERYITGCYNTDCSGFVLEWHHLDFELGPVSVYEGPQKEYTIKISREIIKGAPAWAVYLQGIRMGYYPASLFKNLARGANRVDFGGEVAYQSGGPGSRHTRTDMGSGVFAERGATRAAFIRNMQLFDVNNKVISHAKETIVQENPNCYRAQVRNIADPAWGKVLLYGGPGGDDPKCVSIW